MAETLNEYHHRESGYMLLIKSLLLKLLVLVGREFTTSLDKQESVSLFSRHRDAITGAINYMDGHYTEELNIEAVAKRCLLSQSYFSYLFKSITLKTFVEYLTGLRVGKAMELLRETDRKVADISFEVGFNNVGHFNRILSSKRG